MKLRPLFFVIVLLSVIVGWIWFLGLGLIPSSLSTLARGLSWVAISLPFLMILWLPLVYWSSRKRGRSAMPGFAQLSYFSLGWVSVLFCIVAFRFLVDFAFRFFTGDVPPWLSTGGYSVAVVGVAVAFMLWGYYESRRTPRVRHVSVPIDELPKEWDGFKIAQLSDVHIGHGIRKPFVDRVVARVNEMKPDVIALTGDIVDGTTAELGNDFAALGNLLGPQGRFYVTGNHEYYWGADQWIKAAEAAGFTPLMNQHRTLTSGNANLVIAGIPDPTATQFQQPSPDTGAAIAGAPQNAIRVLLAHRPQAITSAVKHHFHLQLSGHTHGGQFIPWTFFIRFFHPVWRGLKKVRETWVYVSKGTGTWGPPLRLGASAEITLLTLHHAKKA